MKEKDLEKILGFVQNNFESFDLPINEKWGFDSESGLETFSNKKITDFYCLELDPNKDDGRRVMKVSSLHSFLYTIKGEKGRKKLLTKLNKKYLSQRQDELPNLVSSENLQEIKSTVSSINQNLKNINKKNTTQKKIINKKEEILRPYRLQKEGIYIFSYNPIHNTNIKELNEELSHSFKKQFSGIKSYNFSSISAIAIKGELDEISKIKQGIREGRYKFKDMEKIIRNTPYFEKERLRYYPELGLDLKTTSDDILWNLKNIGVDIAHKVTKGQGTTIGIIDTGVDYNHKELYKRFDKTNLGYDFIYDNNEPMDENSHGTHVAGTVAGTNTGIAIKSELYALRVLDKNGVGSSFNVMRAVEWAIDNNIDIVNLSLGGGPYSQPEEEVFMEAWKKGTLAVSAAGNDGNWDYNYPASYKGSLSIAAVDKSNEHADFSNMNDLLTISAPGVSIYSSIPNNSYDIYSGTSMATPHVTGVCGLVKSLKTNYTPEDITNCIMKNAQKLGKLEKYGAGLIRADKIVEELK